jgi:pimeloyl-ACP methyl ester carboxylesterase
MTKPTERTSVRYEIQGTGIPLLLGYPIKASATLQDPEGALVKGYLDRLTDRYRVLVLDYPETTSLAANDFTAHRVCEEILGIAEQAGFDRFAWWGFSWGGLIGLQLACRTQRLTALICGGWPPLGGPYDAMLRAMRTLAATPAPNANMSFDRFVHFYEDARSWSELDAMQCVHRIQCPRMTFVGSADDLEIAGVNLHLAATIRERRSDLEKLGWHVAEIEGRDHSIYTDPGAVVPVVRAFLDRALAK